MQQLATGSAHLTLPNILTLLRMALIPVFLVAYCLPFSWSGELAALLFAIAAITDWVDGYLARRMGQTTKLGAFLDPVADKLMVVAALVLLVVAHSSMLMALPAMVIIGREITVSALREWMAEIGKRANVAVSYLGKVKTAFQMVAITVLLAYPADLNLGLVIFGYALMYIATGLTLWSMLIYLKAALPDLLN